MDWGSAVVFGSAPSLNLLVVKHMHVTSAVSILQQVRTIKALLCGFGKSEQNWAVGRASLWHFSVSLNVQYSKLSRLPACRSITVALFTQVYSLCENQRV